MSRAHRGAPLYRLKNQLEQDFRAWCMERKAKKTTRNMIEFLLQKNFIQGREFLEYCDNIPLSIFGDRWDPKLSTMDGLREGFIIPDTWIGYRKGKQNAF